MEQTLIHHLKKQKIEYKTCNRKQQTITTNKTQNRIFERRYLSQKTAIAHITTTKKFARHKRTR